MTDWFPIDGPKLPTLLDRLAHDYAQKALTTAATALAAHGVLTQTQGAEFTEVGVALAMYGLGVAWTFAAAMIRRSREKQLLLTPPPQPSLPGVGGGR